MMVQSDNRCEFRAYCEALRRPSAERLDSASRSFFDPDAKIHAVHPFNDLTGADEYLEKFLNPLQKALSNPGRSEYIAFGGEYEGQEWVTCTGYYFGQFAFPWLGIKPSNELAYLRFGEFHRMEDGRALESYIYLDIPELMIAVNQWPIEDSPGRRRGYTGYLPGPMSQDGLQWQSRAPEHSASSYEMVTAMLLELATEDEAWRPYWHEDMLWYGPAAFGSFVGVDNFASFQVPFEQTFSEWIGGAKPGSETRHFTRFADGDYICSGGWPSLNAVQKESFLGQPSDGKRLYMRVCDWWRREDDLLVENWVFVDIPHVLLQMGFDLFAEIEPGK